MNTVKRYTRKPVSTVLWLLVILLAALLLGVAASLYFSARSIAPSLDERMMTIAIHQPTHENQGDGTYHMSNRTTMLFEDDIEYLKSLPQVKSIDMRGLSGAYIENLTSKIGLHNWFGQYQDISQVVSKNVNESYQNVVVIGTVEESFTFGNSRYDVHYDLSEVGGFGNTGTLTHCAVLRVEELVSVHPGYHLIFDDPDYKWYDGRITVMFETFGDMPKSFFKTGKRYAVCGAFDPSLSVSGDYPYETRPVLVHIDLKLADAGFAAFNEIESLACYRNIEYEEGDFLHPTEDNPYTIKILSRDGRVPIAQLWDGTVEELKEDPEWGQIIKENDMALHSFPVLGTDCLESMYSFLTKEASIVEGRTFTQEEYETGVKVAVLDAEIAKNAGLSVGDTIPVQQFLAAIGGPEGNNSIGTEWSATGSLINSPGLGGYVFCHGFPSGEPEAFTIVGLYRLEDEWKNSICSFTPNTVFIPKKAQIEGAYGGPTVQNGTRTVMAYFEGTFDGVLMGADGMPAEILGNAIRYQEAVYSIGSTRGVYMSIILENGQMESFLNQLKEDTVYERESMTFTEEELKQYLNEKTQEDPSFALNPDVLPVSGLGKYRFLCFDQGYEAAKASIDAVTASAGKLVLLIAASAALLFAMYLLLYQSSERKTVGIMRSLGAQPKTARRYLFASGFILAAIGILIGTGMSYYVARLVSDRMISLSVSQAGSGFDASYADLFTDMMKEGSVPLSSLLLLALAEIGLSAVVMFIQSLLITKKNPRTLLGK